MSDNVNCNKVEKSRRKQEEGRVKNFACVWKMMMAGDSAQTARSGQIPLRHMAEKMVCPLTHLYRPLDYLTPVQALQAIQTAYEARRHLLLNRRHLAPNLSQEGEVEIRTLRNEVEVCCWLDMDETRYDQTPNNLMMRVSM
jgi:hypothetical protein